MKTQPPSWTHKAAVKLFVVWGAIAAIGWFARLPQLSPSESAAMAKRFRFERAPFLHLGAVTRSHRNVNSRLQRIGGWISSVGAGAALGDLDGDGLSND